jgi:competence protein ComEC
MAAAETGRAALNVSRSRLAAACGDAAFAAIRRFERERERWILWLPVALGAGIGAYFELSAEPSLSAAGLLILAAAACLYLGRGRPLAFALGCGALAAALGFGAAKLRTEWASAPVLRQAIGPVLIRGRILEAEPGHKGLRVVLRPSAVERARLVELPARIRITLHGRHGGLRAGDTVSIRVMLHPPPAPAAPGAYDFQRHAYFERIGAVGYALGAPEKIGEAADRGWADALERLRQSITERIMALLPSPTGALAAAQITGHRHTIPPEVMTAMQDSGLAHLLAISGMNIGIVAGIVFFSVRLILALVPWLALRLATKKWAAVAALIVTFAYVLISGASVPTQRAFLMLAVVMGGILIDREALSMRLVAWAAVIILLAAPEGLLGPSFQMSFAAVVALIACYERYAVRPPSPDPDSVVRRWWRGFLGLALTSLIAGLATAPFGMYSFNRFTTYGLFANLVAVPVTDFWVMPWALLAMLAMPFGLEAWPLAAMGAGVDVVHGVAQFVAALPGAVVPTTVMPGWGLLIFALGGLWLAIWQRPWRWAGTPLMVAGLASMALWQPPDLIIAGDASAMAARARDGGLHISAAGRRAFVTDSWQKRDGGPTVTPWPALGQSADGRIRCDRLGCLYQAGPTMVAILRSPAALADDCAVAALVIILDAARIRCRNGTPVIDRATLLTEGSHAVWLQGGEPRVISDRAFRGERPWVTMPWRRPDPQARVPRAD